MNNECQFQKIGDVSEGRSRIACEFCGRTVVVLTSHLGRVHATCRNQSSQAHAGKPPQPPALAREADPVSWLQKAKNFATATAQHIAAGMPTASDEEILRRWTICQGCEFLKNDACSKCGCPVARDRKFVSKLAWADQSCPVGKWGPVGT